MQPQLLIVQPYLTAYRLPVFAELAKHFGDVILVSSPPSANSGFGRPSIANTAIRSHLLLPERRLFGGRLHWQQGLVRLLIETRPTKLLIAANPRSLSFWAALFACRWLGVSCYSHGQGLYNKPNPPAWLVGAYKILVRFSKCYICYTTSGMESLQSQGITGRLTVAENSLQLTATCRPSEKSGTEMGVLFLGRLRAGCNLSLLVSSLDAARRKTGFNLQLHVIGDGELAAELQAEHATQKWITWHGEIYQQDQIRVIAQHCRVGCHPGDAGLSVVHCMGLSLVPVIHDRLDLHMGPEPSYVCDGGNGRRFSHADAEQSLLNVLTELFTANNHHMASAAFDTYHTLSHPPLAKRLLRVLNEH